MIEHALDRLEGLALGDPATRPLALLQAEVLRASCDPAWEASVPSFDPEIIERGLPLLQDRILTADTGCLYRMLARIAAALAGVDRALLKQIEQLQKMPKDGLAALLEASIDQDFARVDRLASVAGADQNCLVSLGQLIIIPVLLACGRRAAPLLESRDWEEGYCPLCGARPALAELRGGERRWIRCGRCGTGWIRSSHHCVFCGNDDHRTQGYLARDNNWESQRVTTCDRCGGYLKTLATMGPLDPAEVALTDLSTLDLDLAAIEQDYTRPGASGIALGTTIFLT